MSTVNPQMVTPQVDTGTASTARIDSELRTSPRRFCQLTGTGKTFRNVGLILLVIGILFVVYNVFSVMTAPLDGKEFYTYMGVDGFWAAFWEVFWSAQSMTMSFDPRLALYVYGGPILLVLGIVFLIVAATGGDKKKQEKNFNLYAASGFVSEALRIPSVFSVGRNSYTAIAMVAPGADQQAVDSWYAQVVQSASLDKKAFRKNMVAGLRSQGIGTASDKVVFASGVFPGAPDGVLVQTVASTHAKASQEFVAVWTGEPPKNSTLAPMMASFVKTKKL